jgi:hypothetical protein
MIVHLVTLGSTLRRSMMEQTTNEPLVELAPDEAVVRALAQSANPTEFVESNRPQEDTGTDES